MMLKKILFSLISLFISTASFANDALDDINSTVTYRKMKKVMPESEFDWFNSVQTKWIAFRNAECEYHGRRIEAQLECIENMNKERLKEMREILKKYQ